MQQIIRRRAFACYPLALLVLSLCAGTVVASDYRFQSPEVLLESDTIEVTDLAADTDLAYLLDRGGSALHVLGGDTALRVDLSPIGSDFRFVAATNEAVYLAGRSLDSLRRLINGPGGLAEDPDFSAPSMPAAIDPSAGIEDFVTNQTGSLLTLIPSATVVLEWTPGETTWRVRATSSSLENMQLLSTDGASLFVSRIDNRQILRLGPGDSVDILGEALAGYLGLRGVAALAWDAAGERLVVADRLGQNALLYRADGALDRTLADSAIITYPSHVAIAQNGSHYLYDQGRETLLRWRLKSADEAVISGDPFLPHTEGDDGIEPSPLGTNWLSPNIITRQSPLGLLDVDLNNLPDSDPALAGVENYVYVVLNNRVDAPSSGGFISTWWTVRDGETMFPEDWSTEGFEVAHSATGLGFQGAFIDTGELGPLETTIYGPIRWTPDESQAGDCHQENFVMARYLNRYDVDRTLYENPWTEIVNNNDVAARKVEVVRPACSSKQDRYEYNNSGTHIATLEERWSFMGNRCTEEIARELPGVYPDVECPHVFEDAVIPRITPSVSAEQIWSLTIPDLSLHSRDDEDYFALTLPKTDERRWGLYDINPGIVRSRGALQFDYEPEPMPECGSVQRQAPGPSGRDNSLWVNISTELVITAIARSNELAAEPADLSDEYLWFLGAEADDRGRSGLQFSVSCPRNSMGEDPIEFALSHLVRPGVVDPRRPFESTGGYELNIRYVSTAHRGFSGWARDLNDRRGIRPLPCMPMQRGVGIGSVPNFSFRAPTGIPGFGGSLSACLSLPGLTVPGLNIPGLRLPHPRTPGLTGCLADGPGCRELSYFRFLDTDQFRVFELFSEQMLQVQVLDQEGHVLSQATSLPLVADDVAQASPRQSAGKFSNVLDLSNLKEGEYFLSVEGAATDLIMTPHNFQKQSN